MGGLATNFRFLYKDKNFSYITKNIPLFWHCHSLLGGGGEGGEGGGIGGEGGGTMASNFNVVCSFSRYI